MKRNNLIKSIFLKRVIVWAMTVMVALGTVVGGAGSFTVHAETVDGDNSGDSDAGSGGQGDTGGNESGGSETGGADTGGGETGGSETGGADTGGSEDGGEGNGDTGDIAGNPSDGDTGSDGQNTLSALNLTAPTATDPQSLDTETYHKSEETYSDGNKVDDADAADVKANQTEDYTEINTTVEDVLTHYYVTDENGEKVKDEQGNDIEVDAEDVQAVPVIVINKAVSAEETPVYEEITDESKIIYGHFDETGTFVPGTKEQEGDTGYIITDGIYVETRTVNRVITTDADGNTNTTYVNDIIASVLKGVEVDGYEKKVVYYVPDGSGTTELTKEDLEKSYAENDYSIDAETGILTMTAQEHKIKINTITAIKSPGKTEVIDVTGMTVSNIRKNPGNANTYTIEFNYNGKKLKYVVSADQIIIDKKVYTLKTTESVKTDYYYIMVDQKEKKVDSTKVTTTTEYQVVNKETQEVLFEVDAVTLTNILSDNYTLVHDMYKVENKDGQDVYFSADDWNVVTGHEVIYKEVTKNYYVTSDKFTANEFSTEVNGADYKLTVNFWENDVIKLDPDNPVTTEEKNGKVLVTVPYLYKSFDKDGNDIWAKGTYTREMTVDEFGISHVASITVKYAPTISTTEKVTFTTEVVEGTAGTSEILVNGGKPVNQAEKRTKLYDHIDVQIGTNVVIDGITIPATVTDVSVKAVTPYYKNPWSDPDWKESAITMGTIATSDPQGYQEITSTSRKLSINNQQPITISATIQYTYQGVPYSFMYTALVYPANDDFNTCSMKKNGGFDYLISNETITAAIQDHIKTVQTTSTTKTSDIGKAKEDTKQELIYANVYVRSDGVRQLENGQTHYDSSEYSRNLAVDDEQIVLVYSAKGYKVYGADMDDYDTVENAINAYLATDEYKKRLEKIATDYVGRDSTQEYVKNFVEQYVAKLIEEQKAAIMLKNGWAEDANIKWAIDETANNAAIQKAIEAAMVRWYVLKEEGEEYHIDGVVVVPGFTIEVNGEVITIPEIIVTPTPTPARRRTTTTRTVTTTTITPEATPLAAGLTEIPDEGTALAATPEAEVLGADRNPKTDDTTNIWLWISGIAASLAVLTGWKIKRGKEEDKVLSDK